MLRKYKIPLDHNDLFADMHLHSYYSKRNLLFGHQQLSDAIIKDGLWDVYNQIQ